MGTREYDMRGLTSTLLLIGFILAVSDQCYQDHYEGSRSLEQDIPQLSANIKARRDTWKTATVATPSEKSLVRLLKRTGSNPLSKTIGRMRNGRVIEIFAVGDILN